MLEKERRFLVKSDDWVLSSTFSYDIVQGYINTDPKRVVRLRVSIPVMEEGESKSYLTIKGERINGVNEEYEYEIPFDHAQSIFNMCQYKIRKRRHKVKIGKLTWEVDVFETTGTYLPDNLTIAEVELENINDEIKLPPWVGEEITDDNGYSNLSLAIKSVLD